jgi:predicted nucleic acid-binding protein
VRIVVDASVALKWVLNEPDSDIALALREHELVAPALWLAEAANALWRVEGVGQLTAGEAVGLLADLASSPIAAFPMDRYLDASLRLAMELRHPIYDCLYLALAIQLGAHVVTADRRFAALGDRAEMAGRVRLLGS